MNRANETPPRSVAFTLNGASARVIGRLIRKSPLQSSDMRTECIKIRECKAKLAVREGARSSGSEAPPGWLSTLCGRRRGAAGDGAQHGLRQHVHEVCHLPPSRNLTLIWHQTLSHRSWNCEASVCFAALCRLSFRSASLIDNPGDRDPGVKSYEGCPWKVGRNRPLAPGVVGPAGLEPATRPL